MNPAPQNPSSLTPPAAWPFVAPLVIFLLVGSFLGGDISFEVEDDSAASKAALAAAGTAYFWLVVKQVAAAGLALAIGLPAILRQFPLRFSHWGWIYGALGAVLWIGICELQLERQLLQGIGLANWLPERVGFDPFSSLPSPASIVWFLIFRFALLALVVPVAEEALLRGWLARWVDSQDDWHAVPLRSVGRSGLVAVLIYAVAAHPGEALAALAWFGLINHLMLRTNRFWDCVLAHATTNLLLGVYICQTGVWRLW